MPHQGCHTFGVTSPSPSRPHPIPAFCMVRTTSKFCSACPFLLLSQCPREATGTLHRRNWESSFQGHPSLPCYSVQPPLSFCLVETLEVSSTTVWARIHSELGTAPRMSQKCHIEAPEQGRLPQPSAAAVSSPIPSVAHRKKGSSRTAATLLTWKCSSRTVQQGKGLQEHREGVQEEISPYHPYLMRDTANSVFLFQTLYNSIKNEKLEWAM